CSTNSRAEARKALNIAESDFVFLFLGLIRSYKGVPELLAAFEKLDNPNARLVIAGKVHEEDIELEDLLHQKASADQSIQFIPGFVPDEDIQIYMNAADTVVFPYRDILTSGAVLLAMSFGQSCVAPRIGCISETLDSDGAFLYDPQLDSGLLEAIQKSIRKRHELPRMGKHNMRLAEGYSWERVANMTQTIYRA
ncbi:MAG: glycosyltransferase, partial [Cyanobacteria bacterium J06634_6]